MKIDISVIVPVYKIEEKLLRNCLQTLCDQTLESVEFIVVDDGSPDNCGEICDEYACKDSRIRVIHTENMGVSNARNVGIKNSQGRYIAFVDGDDFIERDMCEKCIEAMDRAQTDILFFMHMTTKRPWLDTEETMEIRELLQKEIEEIRISIISQANPFIGYWIGSPWGKVFKRDIIQENNLNFVLGIKKSQDRIFVLDYMMHVKKAALFCYCGYHYVSNEQSICHRYNEKIIPILEGAQREFTDRVNLYRDNNCEYKQAIDTMNLIFISEYLALKILNHDNKNSNVERVKEIKNLMQQEKYKMALMHGKMDNISRRKRVPIYFIKYRVVYLAVIIGKMVI